MHFKMAERELSLSTISKISEINCACNSRFVIFGFLLESLYDSQAVSDLDGETVWAL